MLPETPSPLVDISHEDDPLLERLVTVVQAADNKRGIDMSAFWISQGYEIVVIITALSRPQLQAVATEIDYRMRKVLRVKRQRRNYWLPNDIRREAATGWSCLVYKRLTVHVMTPVQRSYYDIEGTWRDDNQDYEKIPLDDLLREEGFGGLRLTKELKGESRLTDEDVGAFDDEDEYEEGFPGVDAEIDYEEDEEDPFWS